MASIGIDHIAIPTADAERLILFYKKLGFTINDEKEWREGKVNIFTKNSNKDLLQNISVNTWLI